MLAVAVCVVMGIAGAPLRAAAEPLAPAKSTPVASAKRFADGSDVAVDGQGASDGYHVRIARASSGFAWSDIAVLRPAALDPGAWYGYQCLTDDGKYIAVAVLPGDEVNDNTARERGAYAYAIDVKTGRVHALATGVALEYHTPGCGLDDTAVFTASLGSQEQQTEVLRYDLSTGTRIQQSVVQGQVTSAVPTKYGVQGALASSIVRIPIGGTMKAPVKAFVELKVAGPAYDVHPASDGGLDYVTAAKSAGRAIVWHEASAHADQVGSGKSAEVRIFQGRAGKNSVIGTAGKTGTLRGVPSSQLPLGVATVSLDGGAAFGPAKSSPQQKKSAPASAVQAAGVSSEVQMVESEATHQVFKTKNAVIGQASASRGAGAQVSGEGSQKPASGAKAPAKTEVKVKAGVFTGTGPLAPALAVVSDGAGAAEMADDAGSPACAVARLDPTLQAMQPSNGQVDWATEMAEQGLLTGSQYQRPADFANMGLAAYDPSDDFSPIALDHPSGDSWDTVPRSVMLAIESQESNFNQASWHALPGIAGDPLIADYYGAGDAIDTIDYDDADCGYGVAQVTDGMFAGDGDYSTHGQMKIAVDYEENVAAGLNILESTWNQLYEAGITANGGDPRYLENWYFAVWAYNTGIQPTASFGNTSGCTPGPSCEGPDGTWGLGWSNNPQNPDYDPSRGPYLESTYADAAHPASWPYQERIMGWMGSPIIRYGYTAYDPPDYHGGHSWLQIAPFDSFCSSADDCDTSNASGGYCSLSDSECWWHKPVTWISDCSTSCATSAYEDGAGSEPPAYTAKYQPTCNLNTANLPSNSIIVDDLSNPVDNDEGCTGMNWSNSGSFTYSPGTNSSGDAVGDIDTHQLGSGFGGHILFTHTEPSSDTDLINTGTWKPTLPSLQYYEVEVHLPESGATATDVVYTVNPGGGASAWKIRVNQDWESEEWVPIGTFAMQNGGNVVLTNASSETPQGYDVAYDAIAFVPKGGTPGQSIGGPPTIQDEPAGSNPALVNCGCATRAVADPVDTSTGYFTQSATDLSVPGFGEPLNLTRTYTSSLADPSGPAGNSAVNGAFGPGWTYSYGLVATTDSSGNVTIRQEDGSMVSFTDSSGTYTPPARYDATLTASSGNYYFIRHGSEQFVFAQSTGRLIAESDQAGRVATPSYQTSLAYDSSGNLQTVTDPAGRTLTLTWSGGHITSVADSGGQQVDYQYSTAGDLTDVFGVGTTRTGGTDGNQDHAQYAYNASHLMTSMRSPNNYGKSGTPSPVTSMTYDSSERVLTQTDPEGNETTFEYGPNTGDSLVAGQTLVTTPTSDEDLYTYQNGLLAQETKAYGTDSAQTWKYSYDPISLGVSQQTNPDGSVETFSYDAQGHQISSSNGLGQTTSKQYNAAGQVTEVTDPNGTHTITSYNAAGAPTSVLTTEDGQSAESYNNTLDPTYSRQSTYAYTDEAHPAEATVSTDANSNATHYGYDSLGDLTTVTDAAGHVTDYGYNTALGERTSTVTPTGTAAGTTPTCTPPAIGCTTYAYDAYGHVITTTDPLGHSSKATYDADGNQLTTVDANGHTTTTSYDAADRATSVEQPSGATSSTSYNGDGTIKKTTDANGKATTYTYNALGLKESSTDPDGSTTSYTYDADGRLKIQTSPDGETMTDTWNNAGELTGIAYSGSGTHAVSYTYDPDGNRLAMTDGTGTTSYSYDVFNEETNVTTGAGNTVGYGYDAAGNVTTINYPGTAGTVTDHYNTLEQLSSVVDPAGNSTSFGYTADGQLTTTNAANGTTVTVSYNNADQPTSSVLSKGSTGLGTVTYARNNNGDLTGTTPSAGAPGSTETYGYNNNEQLTSAIAGSTTTSYGYDAAGNPTTLGSVTQVFDAAGRLCWTTTSSVSSPSCASPASGATTYTYNGDGQRTAQTPAIGTATNYAYNAAGELTSVSGAVAAAYTYNGDGFRASKTVGSSTTTFTYNTLGAVPLLLTDGTTAYIYGPSGTPVEQLGVNGSDSQYYFADTHGSTIELTNSSGAVDGSYSYDAWGKTTSHAGAASTPIQFAGAYSDSETGLYYLLARYYDPATALLISVDPLNALTLSPYGYVDDSPLNVTDPTGLWWGGLCFGGSFVGAAGVAVLGGVEVCVDWASSSGLTLTAGYNLMGGGGADADASLFLGVAGGAADTAADIAGTGCTVAGSGHLGVVGLTVAGAGSCAKGPDSGELDVDLGPGAGGSGGAGVAGTCAWAPWGGYAGCGGDTQTTSSSTTRRSSTLSTPYSRDQYVDGSYSYAYGRGC
ncbi:RHS repeat-associated core domain-containing protein [Humibacter ginsenosidimutans]|nr:RHS repeat-associated core domain-containing protein [Humibacter ginsenosidimutans]